MHGLESIAFIGEGCDKIQEKTRDFVSDILSFPRKLVSLVKFLTSIILSDIEEVELDKLSDSLYRKGLMCKHRKIGD